jgi:hypothetical protein
MLAHTGQPWQLSGPDTEASLDQIEQEAGRLSEPIEQLLTLGGVETGVMRMEKTPVAATPWCKESSRITPVRIRSYPRAAEAGGADAPNQPAVSNRSVR